MDDGSGGRSRRCESPAGLTLGGILSIKQTPPYRIHERTLLDLIRDDQSCRKETKKMWKMLREKFRLKLAGSACTTTVPTHVHVTGDTNRVVSPSVNDESSVTTVVDAESVNVRTEVLVEERERTSPEEDAVAGGGGGGGGGGEGGEPTAARMSLMSLLEVEGSVYFDDDDDDEDDDEVEEEDEAVVDGGGDGGGGGGDGGGGYRYNNCCVCMVRHKGAAFIPCGHTFCRLCSRELFVKRASCPLCNNFILEILDIF